MTRGERILQLADALARALDSITWRSPVTHMYNPLVYAREGLARFVHRALADGLTRRVLLVGLNPGPHGAVHTGVPFGDPTWARHLVGADVKIGQPPALRSDRPVLGLTARDKEVSGRRLWDGLTRMWTSAPVTVPDNKIQHALDVVLGDVFLMNYCPIALFGADGKNITPDDLRKAGGDRSDLEHMLTSCDAHLRDVVDALSPDFVVGVGGYAHTRIGIALGHARVRTDGSKLVISKVLHPSPQSPLANAGWFDRAQGDLRSAGVIR